MLSRSLVAVLLLVVLAAGCGDKKSEGSGAATDPAGASGGKFVAVAMKDILFVPEKVTARVGQSVRWTNEDEVQHTVQASKGADFESKTLSKGDTYVAKLTKPGTIDYVCTIHPSQRGTITVVAQ
jgi:plastocyanin